MTSPTSYRVGDRGAAVAEIRGKLAVLGLLPPAPHRPRGDTEGLSGAGGACFDGVVDRAVRSFQQQRGLAVDGIVGPQTYRALDEARWRLGDRILSHAVSHLIAGDDVATLQRRLQEMGFDCGRVDGIFGPDTEAALREFQRNVGLPPDGTCGPSTLKMLGRLARTIVGGRPDVLRDETALATSGPALSGKVVVVDPGHGGPDRGICAFGLEEAALVEDLASRVEGRLAATGVLAFLTRGPDGVMVDGTLVGTAPAAPLAGEIDAERAAFANAAEADLLVSLHVDSSPDPRAQGVATYYYGNDRYGHSSPVGERFAELVQREIVARTDLVDCRTHAKTYDLMRRTRMPAVRIELGYLTNSGDAGRLADPGFRDVIAEAIVIAVGRLYLPPGEDVPTGTLRLPEFATR